MHKNDELQLCIESLNNFNFKFSVICIQESWLSQSDDNIFKGL